MLFSTYSIGYYLKIQTSGEVLGDNIDKTSLATKLGDIVINWQDDLPAKSAVYISEADGGLLVSQRGDQQIVSASLYKYYVAYLLLKNNDKTPGVLDKTMPNGLTAGECMRLMIVVSDNDCSEALGKYIGWANVDKAMKRLGLKNTSINNYSADGSYKGNKITTANDLGLFLEKLYKNQLLSAKSTTLLMQYLQSQQLNERIPSTFPNGVTIAHKTGTLADKRHDAGYIFGKNGDDLVFVVMTYGWDKANLKNADKSIQKLISKIITENEIQ